MRNPLQEIDVMRREIDRVFDGAGAGPFRPWRLAFLPGRAARQYPLINLHDDGETMQIEALAPGVATDQLEITVVGTTLTISGQKSGPANVAPERVHRSERSAGRFVRTFQLPAEIERERTTAEYRHGLVLLTLPRAESAKPRRIEVKHLSGT